MNDLEMYREQLAMCDDKLIDALVERNGIIEKIIDVYKRQGLHTCYNGVNKGRQNREVEQIPKITSQFGL